MVATPHMYVERTIRIVYPVHVIRTHRAMISIAHVTIHSYDIKPAVSAVHKGYTSQVVMFLRRNKLSLQPTACERQDCGAPLEVYRIRDGVVSWRCCMRKCRKTAPLRHSCFLTTKGKSKDDRQQLQVLHQLAWGMPQHLIPTQVKGCTHNMVEEAAKRYRSAVQDL